MMDHLRTLSIGTTSLGSFVVSVLTQNNIAWGIGILAGLATIISGYYSFRQHKRSEVAAEQKTEMHEAVMKKLKTELQAEQLKVEHYKRHLDGEKNN